MKLLLDIGNTKITIYIKNKDNDFTIYLTDTLKNEKVGKNIYDLIKDYEITSCFISSVVPEINKEIVEYLVDKGIKTSILTNEMYEDLMNFGDLDYKNMGADRVVVDVAAINKYGKDVIVFDLGTAITVDAIKDGGYMSGYIFPGIRLIRDSLIAGASQLDTFEFTNLSKTNTALDTFTQLNDGIMYGVLGSINQYIKLCKKHYTDEVPVILTGGSMYNILKIIPKSELKSILEADIIIDLELMVEGLDFISENRRLKWNKKILEISQL